MTVSYEEMTDSDINMAVGQCLGFEVYCNSARASVNAKHDYCWFSYDPCNKPVDSWPIIAKCKIDVEWGDDDFVCAAKYNHGEIDIHYHDRNPLRAAMIVFLKIKESEK